MISQQSLDFLKDLAVNNNREWFQLNKERYERSREEVIAFTAALIKEIGKIDPTVETAANPQKAVMRIYRDIRFSKDKTPYKRNFGVSITTYKKSGRGPEYYLQIEPGKSFIAGGYWQPEADHLKAIRQEIDYNAAGLKKIINDAAFVKMFGDFTQQERLKTLPRDYAADNENIELLKLKSFVAFHNLKDSELLKNGVTEKIADICSKIYPLNVFLNNALV